MKHLRDQFIKGTTGTLLLKVASTGFGFITSLVLARILKAEGLGIYSYAMAWVFILSIPSILGLDRSLVRDVSVYNSQKQCSLLRGLISYAKGAVTVSSVFIILCVIFFVKIFESNVNSLKLKAFLVALFLLPLSTFSTIIGSVLKGLQRVVIAQVPEMLTRPVTFLSLVVFSFFFVSRRLSPVNVISLNIIAFAVTTMILFYLLHKSIPKEVRSVKPEYRIRDWFRSGLILLMLTGMGLINARTDIVMLGAMKEAKTVGIYSVATTGASLVTFVFFSVNTSLGPILARLYRSGEISTLQREITYSARFALLITLPIVLVLTIFGKRFLLLYGDEFTSGYIALTVLCLAQLINVFAGSVGLVLVMTGHEKDASLGFGVGALVNILLNLLLIPKWSMEGAAVATGVSIVVWNTVMTWFVWKRLGLYTTAFGNLRRLGV